MNTNIGMVGEFRCVVKKSDGSTKIDTGYQKNLILNQGLDFFGRDSGYMTSYCVIGSGNSVPSFSQNNLDAFLAATAMSTATEYPLYKTDYDKTRDGDLYKASVTNKYSFTNIVGNVSEVGLASDYTNSSSYNLCTRALIKDSNGNPTTISVLSGETLDIYYKLWRITDLTDKNTTLNVLGEVGGSVAYNVITRPSHIGFNSGDYDYANKVIGIPAANRMGSALNVNGDTGELTIANSRFNPVNSSGVSSITWSPYVQGSYKRQLTANATVNDLNLNIRRFQVQIGFGDFQFRVGKVSDDSPLVKNNTQTLSIPIEVSWGRYEGTL